jgi:hypothetical protein
MSIAAQRKTRGIPAGWGSRGPSGRTLGRYDLRFRAEVAALVGRVLEHYYVHGRREAEEAARRRKTTVEQAAARAITRLVMTKVDEEYV